jgi:acetolactate synthase-1/2/3 large subunit
MKGAQLVARILHNEGVEIVFGLCGHTHLPLLDALAYETDIRFVSFRHEQVAAHAADGYARVTRKPGVLLLHVGPGMTNAVTGVATAALDSIPLVVIAGDIPGHFFGYDPHQEMRRPADGAQYEIYRPFVKRSWRLRSADQFPDVLSRAFNVALSGRPGPVLVDVPMDVFSEETQAAVPDSARRRPTGLRQRGDAAEIERAVDLLVAAERPLIYAGGGVIGSRGHRELVALAEHLGIPVATSLMGKGAIPEDHPLALGMTGLFGTPMANRAAQEADVLLAVGTRFAEMDASSWNPDYTFRIPPSKLIHVDIDPTEIGKIYPVEVGVVGDAQAVLSDLYARAGERTPQRDGEHTPRMAEIEAQREAWHARIDPHHHSDAVPIRPERILHEVRRALPRDGIILTDTGWNKNGVGQQFPIYEPHTHHPPGGLATMGFGPAAAIGAKLGRPERVVLALVGDGAFSSVSPALCTAVEQGIAPIWVVMNNYAYGVITGMQRYHFRRTAGTEFRIQGSGELYNPDFAALARAYGAQGEHVERPEELGPALRRAIDSGEPYVLDVVMDREVSVPMTGFWDVNAIISPDA